MCFWTDARRPAPCLVQAAPVVSSTAGPDVRGGGSAEAKRKTRPAIEPLRRRSAERALNRPQVFFFGEAAFITGTRTPLGGAATPPVFPFPKSSCSSPARQSRDPPSWDCLHRTAVRDRIPWPIASTWRRRLPATSRVSLIRNRSQP